MRLSLAGGNFLGGTRRSDHVTVQVARNQRADTEPAGIITFVPRLCCAVRRRRIKQEYVALTQRDVDSLGSTGRKCPVPLTVRGTQALVSFAPLAFKLFYAARQNAVLRRSSFPSLGRRRPRIKKIPFSALSTCPIDLFGPLAN